MTRKALILLLFLSSFHAYAQLPDGAIAPNWTLTDLDGNSHNLYDVLESGQHVILDFGATWCGPCWNYHQSGILDDLHHDYGPDGTNEIRVFMIEADGGTNDACLYGQPGCSGGTTGDWVTGTDYPIINLSGADLGVENDYDINYYPTLYAINAEHNTVWETGQLSYGNWETLLFESFELDANPNVITGSCDDGGVIELNPSGGAGNFLTYSWSNGSTSEDATNLPTGIYSVTCTDAFSYFESFENIYVENDESDLEIISEWTGDISCYGAADGSIELTVSSGGSVSYFWNNGMSGNLIEGLPQGVYDVTIVNNENNCEITASYFVDEPEEILLEGYPESATCSEANGYIEYYYEGGVAPFFVYLNGVAVNNNPIVDLAGGNYDLEIQDGNNCSVFATVFVGNEDAPVVQIAEPEVITCASETTLLDASNSLGDNLSFSWTDASGVVLGDEAMVEVSEAGMYSCEIIDLDTDCAVTDFVIVNADLGVAEINILAPDAIECVGGTTAILAEEIADVEALWFTNDGDIIEGQDGFTLMVGSAGLYYLQITKNGNGCVHVDSVEVVALGNSAEAQFNYTLNENTLVIEDLSVGTELSYMWDFGDGNISTTNVTEYTYAEAGVYELCLEVTNNCGVSNTCKSVFVGGATNYDAIIEDVSCFGFGDGSIKIEPTSGVPDFEITWEGTGGFISNAFVIENLSVGTYTMVLTDATGAFIEASFNIQDAPELILSSSNIVNDENGEGLGSIMVEAEGGTGELSYLWEDGTEGPVIMNLVEGSYTVDVMDENACVQSFDFEVGNEIISSTGDVEEALHFEVFPNPARDYIKVQFELENVLDVQLSLIAIDGRILRTEKVNSVQNTISWHIVDLDAGVYLLKIEDGRNINVKTLSILR